MKSLIFLITLSSKKTRISQSSIRSRRTTVKGIILKCLNKGTEREAENLIQVLLLFLQSMQTSSSLIQSTCYLLSKVHKP